MDPEANVDDLNPDEQAEAFPDPIIEAEETELADSSESAPPVVEAELDLPAVQPEPPPPTYAAPPPPPDDQGFTPYTPPREQIAPAQPAPAQQMRYFSIEELDQGVMNGQITENQKITQLQLQSKEDAKREALQAFKEENRTQSITRELNQYRQAVPGWDQPGSQANKQATPAYERLLARGLADNDTTRLLALEQTFGTLNRLQEARVAQTRTASLRDTPKEVGRRGSPPASRTQKDPLDFISMEDKRQYKSYIEKGLYKDWNEVRAEIKYAANQDTNPQLRDAHAGLRQ